MARKFFLPNLPLVGEEGTWESITGTIRERIMPQIELLGDSLFQANLRPLPVDCFRSADCQRELVTTKTRWHPSVRLSRHRARANVG
jgi:hypothetical protein